MLPGAIGECVISISPVSQPLQVTKEELRVPLSMKQKQAKHKWDT